MEHIIVKLTLESLFRLIYNNYLPLYNNQQRLFAAIFRSYHDVCSDANKCQWLTNQGIIASLLSGSRITLPRDMLVYYSRKEGHKRLQNDIYSFIDDLALTAQQLEDICGQLLSLVTACTNLNKEDQCYILAYAEMPPEWHVSELLYRAMAVSICNSLIRTSR